MWGVWIVLLGVSTERGLLQIWHPAKRPLVFPVHHQFPPLWQQLIPKMRWQISFPDATIYGIKPTPPACLVTFKQPLSVSQAFETLCRLKKETSYEVFDIPFPVDERWFPGALTFQANASRNMAIFDSYRVEAALVQGACNMTLILSGGIVLKISSSLYKDIQMNRPVNPRFDLPIYQLGHIRYCHRVQPTSDQSALNYYIQPYVTPHLGSMADLAQLIQTIQQEKHYDLVDLRLDPSYLNQMTVWNGRPVLLDFAAVHDKRIKPT